MTALLWIAGLSLLSVAATVAACLMLDADKP